MKSFFSILFFFCFGQSFAQEMLYDVITNFTNIRNKNKVVKVTLPDNCNTAFYRITVFRPEKVNTYDGFHTSIRPVSADELRKSDYNFEKHLLENNSSRTVDVLFLNDEKEAKNVTMGKEATSFLKIESKNSTVGRIDSPKSKDIYVGIVPRYKNEPLTVKVELVALATPTSNINDKYPFTIQNENDTTVVYEISGDRRNWEVFHLPKRKKAVFNLAAPSVYFRVSTVVKTSEEYLIETDKKYRLFWNKDNAKVDLSELK